MKIWNASEDDIRAAVAEVGLAIHADWAGNGVEKDGRALRFRLALGTDRVAEGFEDREPGQRKRLHPLRWQRSSAHYSMSERRVAAVCWHGHYAFMRYLFAKCPDARIQTKMADYRGIAAFERDAWNTGLTSVGSLAFPMQAREACFCSDYAEDDTSSIDHAADDWAGKPLHRLRH